MLLAIQQAGHCVCSYIDFMCNSSLIPRVIFGSVTECS